MQTDYYYTAIGLLDVATGKRLWVSRPFSPSGYFYSASVGDDGFVYTTEASSVSDASPTTKSCLRYASTGNVATCTVVPNDFGSYLYPTCVASPGIKTEGYITESNGVVIFNVAATGSPVSSLVNLTIGIRSESLREVAVLSAGVGRILVEPGDGLVHAYSTQGSYAGNLLWSFNCCGELRRTGDGYEVNVISYSSKGLVLTVTSSELAFGMFDDDDDIDTPDKDITVLFGLDSASGRQIFATAMDSKFDWCVPSAKYNGTSILCQGREAFRDRINGNWWLISPEDGGVIGKGTVPPAPSLPANGRLIMYAPFSGGIVTLSCITVGEDCATWIVAYMPSLLAGTYSWFAPYTTNVAIVPASDNSHIILLMVDSGIIMALDSKGKFLWKTTNEPVSDGHGGLLYPENGFDTSHSVPFNLLG
jgi:hypothetical protein